MFKAAKTQMHWTDGSIKQNGVLSRDCDEYIKDSCGEL